MDREEIGQVNHYYSKIAVAIIEMSGDLETGEKIAVVGPKTDIVQVVKSMQVDHRNIEQARAGDLVGLKVKEKVREGDRVFRIRD